MNARDFKWLLPLLVYFLSFASIFSQENNFSYICPENGSGNLNPEQNIILKHKEGFQAGTFRDDMIGISGTISGPVAFNFFFNKTNDVLIVKPAVPFKYGEMVSVSYSGGMLTSKGIELSPISIHFKVRCSDRKEICAKIQEEASGQVLDQAADSNPIWIVSGSGNNLPPDFPAPVVYNYGELDDEYFFMNLGVWNASLPWENYLTIIDAEGIPVYYEKSEFNRNNFGKLPNGNLCYAINLLNNSPQEKYYIMDPAFKIIDSVNTGNGYILDSHDMLLLDNGNYLVMSYDPQPVDMSQVVQGGNPAAIVTGLVIQEVDNQENVYFQWRSWDHFEITDATPDVNLLGTNIDYVHGNALEIDYDGNILLSSRHLDEITKINFNTGDIMWRFGLNSDNNMFQIFDDPDGFSHQHDIRRLNNGNYTIYDNGNLNSPQISKGREYVLDQQNLSATLVWEWNHPSQIYSQSAGSFRVLNSGQRIVGWGGTYPRASTVLNEEEDIIQEIHLPNFVNSYRVFKSTWETSAFSTQDVLSLGNYAGYVDWKINKLYIFNTCNSVVKITSVYFHLEEFVVLSELPVSIFPGSYKSIDIGFKPQANGDFTDKITVNFDNADNSRRIARQLELKAYYDENCPEIHFKPGYGSTQVSPDTVVQIIFSDPVTMLFGGEIHNDDIPFLVEFRKEYFNGQAVPYSGSINDEKTVITLTPDQILSSNQQYYIKLNGNMVVDENENIIKLDEECYFTTGLITSVPSGIEDGFSLFPNPTEGMFMLIFPVDRNREIMIFSAGGNLVYTTQHYESRLDIDLSAQPAGIYFYYITEEEGNILHSGKIIKH